MTVTCPKCKTRLNLSEEKKKQEGMRVRCAKCGAVLVYKGKGRRQAPERAEQKGAAAPSPSGEVRASLEGGEPGGLDGEAKRPSEPPPPETARDEPSDRGEPTTVPSRKGDVPPTPNNAMRGHEMDMVFSPGGEERGTGVPGRAVMMGSAAAVLVLLLVAVFIFRSPQTETRNQPVSVPPVVQEPSTQLPAGSSTQESSPAVTAEVPPPAFPAEETAPSTPEEKAIAMVKRSDVLLQMTSVESIVNKWTQDSAGKYKVVGWQAKKIDEQKYLVSYTALDGNTPKGFYFIADLQDGGVEDLAHNPELQKKYNVEYGR